MAPSEATVLLLGPNLMATEMYGKTYGKKPGFPSRCHSPWDAITMIQRPTQ